MKYKVNIKQIEKYYMKVEASNKEEAEMKAWDLFDKDKHKYHDDSDSEVTVIDIDDGELFN